MMFFNMSILSLTEIENNRETVKRNILSVVLTFNMKSVLKTCRFGIYCQNRKVFLFLRDFTIFSKNDKVKR